MNDKTAFLNALSKRDKSFRTASIVLNVVWGLLVLPVGYTSLWGMIGTLISTDGNEASVDLKLLGNIVAIMFMVTPVVILICIFLSFGRRKEWDMQGSVFVQIVPAVYIAITSALLFIVSLFS